MRFRCVMKEYSKPSAGFVLFNNISTRKNVKTASQTSINFGEDSYLPVVLYGCGTWSLTLR
jgi:hypothetical protein